MEYFFRLFYYALFVVLKNNNTLFFIQLISILGVDCMRENATDRSVILGEYILETGATVRAAAKVFKISKSTVHTVVTV